MTSSPIARNSVPVCLKAMKLNEKLRTDSRHGVKSCGAPL